MNPEKARLAEARDNAVPWKKWGPYVSERQWGTVREDLSEHGDAWNSFSHDQARSRTYRWGEDGLAGICDEEQRLCFALALWNGRDAILKERLFGLTNGEGIHGEDVKEYYYYLDSTPTHSYMRYLYKYPQAAFPYADLVETNRSRSRGAMEYELVDTGIFDEDRYFDVFVEYAKASAEDVLVRITVHNRGPEDAELWVVPTLWFRNTWSWGGKKKPKPVLRDIPDGTAHRTVAASHPKLGERFLHCEGRPLLCFTENETNTERVFGVPNASPYVKDGINACIVDGRTEAVNPDGCGTKASAVYRLTVPAGGERVLQLRLTRDRTCGATGSPFGPQFDDVFTGREMESDEFYASVIPFPPSSDEARVMRQALAGMLWTKQFYLYDVNRWLEDRGAGRFAVSKRPGTRNDHWHHMYCSDVISMPDKWEYPWFAAWDLAFHVLALTLVDEDFGKQQLELMLRTRYLHPNGQIPAYEWNFGDVNPPVHAWATVFTYRLEKGKRGTGDVDWLERSFHKLLLNFTWWVNRKDRTGMNVFEGGFLGLDNIGVFDRSAPLPTGGYLEQADGTAWMGLFSLNMFEIATELASQRPAYAPACLKFLEHFLWIASAMDHTSEGVGMWDEEDGFFYDVLRLPGGEAHRLKVRSMVGLLPFCAVAQLDELPLDIPIITARIKMFFEDRPTGASSIHDPRVPGANGRYLGAILSETMLRRVLARMLDENEFLSEFGIRSLSRYHADNPYTVHVGDEAFQVAYLPAESDSGMFGGNSNWRGPIWIPVNMLIIRALTTYYGYYGDTLKVECPTGSGRFVNLFEVAEEISRRLANIFLRDESGRRPVFGGSTKFQEDPHWRDHLLFYEYFHGDNGAGLGASHQTGWTSLVARTMHIFEMLTPEMALASGRKAYFG